MKIKPAIVAVGENFYSADEWRVLFTKPDGGILHIPELTLNDILNLIERVNELEKRLDTLEGGK